MSKAKYHRENQNSEQNRNGDNSSCNTRSKGQMPSAEVENGEGK